MSDLSAATRERRLTRCATLVWSEHDSFRVCTATAPLGAHGHGATGAGAPSARVVLQPRTLGCRHALDATS